jgi:hypothetical protein
MPVLPPTEERTLMHDLLSEFRARGDQPLRTWERFEDIQRDLEEKFPEGATDPKVLRSNRIARGTDGRWYREVPRHLGEGSIIERDGQPMYSVVWDKHLVGLSRAECQAATRAAREEDPQMDFWGGWSWWRRGMKPEKDICALNTTVPAERIEWEPASPHDLAQYRGAKVRVESAKSEMPRVSTKDK